MAGKIRTARSRTRRRTRKKRRIRKKRFQLRGVYSVYPDFMLKRMKEEERANLVTEFRCSLFEDLSVRLEEVFYRVTPGV